MPSVSASTLYFLPILIDHFVTFNMSSDVVCMYVLWEENDSVWEKLMMKQVKI